MEQIAQYIDYMWPDFVWPFLILVAISLLVTFAFDMKQRLDKDDEDE